MKLAIAQLTCDRMELVEQSAKPLREAASHPHSRFHWYIVDGSQKPDAEKRLFEIAYPTANFRSNIRGGAGAAIVYALTMLLQHAENYTHVGLLESDVLLHDGWLASLDLFSKGEADGLVVGAASARCFADRVLFQRDGYAVMHNLGAGCIVFTRQAAEIVLRTFRTALTTDNRRIFGQLCGVDIAAYWAFRGNEHFLTADWHWDAALAAHGLASLALTPSPVEMIGQNPPLHEQGLHIVGAEPPEFEIPSVKDEEAFERYCISLHSIRKGTRALGVETTFQSDPNTGTWTYFPHQMAMLGGTYSGDWRLRELRGWGTFGWEAREIWNHKGDGSVIKTNDPVCPELIVPAFGPVAILVSGGKTGGKVEIVDEKSGFKAQPDLVPEGDSGNVLAVQIPAGVSYRNTRVTALTPGIVFYGIQSREKQPFLPNVSFDHSVLPPA